MTQFIRHDSSEPHTMLATDCIVFVISKTLIFFILELEVILKQTFSCRYFICEKRLCRIPII